MFVIVIQTLFLMASNTHICSVIIMYFAYCRNILANNTAIHHNIINHITNQLFNTSNVINLNTVIEYVYGQNEKAKPFNSNIVKKSPAHFHIAFHIPSF